VSPLATVLDDAMRAVAPANVDFGSLGLAWARTMPAVLLGPADLGRDASAAAVEGTSR